MLTIVAVGSGAGGGNSLGGIVFVVIGGVVLVAIGALIRRRRR
jgi:hypothetical protein